MPSRSEPVAPAQPFVDAINEWISREVGRRQAHAFAGIINVSHPRYPAEFTARRALGERAGINRHLMDDLMEGRRPFLDVRRADRLALALGIPLVCLADEFKPLEEWQVAA